MRRDLSHPVFALPHLDDLVAIPVCPSCGIAPGSLVSRPLLFDEAPSVLFCGLGCGTVLVLC